MFQYRSKVPEMKFKRITFTAGTGLVS